MASNSNMLLDPIQELAQVLSMNTFGLAPSPTTQILLEASFPITDEDKVRVAEEQVRSGEIGERVRARANVGLLEGDVLEVVLDRRGYTVSLPRASSRHPMSAQLIAAARVGHINDIKSLSFHDIRIARGYAHWGLARLRRGHDERDHETFRDGRWSGAGR